MKKTLLFLLALFIISCQPQSDLDKVVEKHPELKSYIESLQKDSLFYKKCDANLRGYDKHTLLGYAYRIPPKGNYYKKEVEIGAFDYDSFFIYEKQPPEERVSGVLYFCYVDERQKKVFLDFKPYYDNLFMYRKEVLIDNFVGNILILKIIYGG